jgi:hypothetical protein
VHAALEALLRDIIPSAAVRADVRRRLTEISLGRVQAKDLERSGLRMELAGLHQRERHLTRTFTQGVLRQAAYDEALASVDSERRQVNAKLKSLPISDDNRHTVLRPAIATARTAWDLYQLFSFDERRVLLEVLFERLDINRTGIVTHALRRYPQAVDNEAA